MGESVKIEQILPFISMFAVSNTALINMLMASRLIYGMARQHVLPPVLGAVHPRRHTPWVANLFTTAIAFGLITYVTAFANSDAIAVLGGTTSLLLLAVFAVLNIAVLVLRRDVRQAGGTSRRQQPSVRLGRNSRISRRGFTFGERAMSARDPPAT